MLIDFWATWCGPCQAELRNVLKVYSNYQNKGFEIIGVSLDQDKDKLKTFLKKKRIVWPQIMENAKKVATAYRVFGIRMTVLLDKSGRIYARNLHGEALEAAVKSALAEK